MELLLQVESLGPSQSLAYSYKAVGKASFSSFLD